MIILHLHPLDPRDSETLEFYLNKVIIPHSQEPNQEVSRPELGSINNQLGPKRLADLVQQESLP